MTPRQLRISPELALPVDAITQTFAIFGKRGSGKSNTGVVLAEELQRAGAPVVVLDPINAWWGLKASFDGKGPGLPVYIFGGPHADLPLQPTAGELMAQVFIAHRIPMVLCMKGWTGADRARFVTAFALYLLAHNDRVPMHVFIEEADAFVPQRPYKGEEAMLGAMDRLVRWGRQEGIGATLITQRSAKVNKDVTTQAETLVAHRTVGPQDRDAIDAWIKFHAGDEQRHQVLSTLPTLPDGTAWIWSPEWLGILKQVRIRRRETYDSAATPKLGEKRPQPKELAAVDVERLRGQLADTIERAKAEDPKELRRRIQQLEQDRDHERREYTAQLARLQKELAKKEAVRIEVPVFPEKVQEWLLDIAGRHEQIGKLMREGVRDLAKGHRAHVAEIPVEDNVPLGRGERRPSASSPAPRPVAPAPMRQATNGAAPRASTSDSDLGAGERKVLAVLAQWPDGRTHNELAFLAGYSAKASTLGVILSKLRKAGLVEPGQPIRAAEAGLAAAGGVQQLPAGPQLLEHWLRHPRMGEGERKVLQALIDAYPEALSHDDLAQRTDYSPTASTLGVILSKLRKLGLVEKGARRVPAEFMEALAL